MQLCKLTLTIVSHKNKKGVPHLLGIAADFARLVKKHSRTRPTRVENIHGNEVAEVQDWFKVASCLILLLLKNVCNIA